MSPVSLFLFRNFRIFRASASYFENHIFAEIDVEVVACVASVYASLHSAPYSRDVISSNRKT